MTHSSISEFQARPDRDFTVPITPPSRSDVEVRHQAEPIQLITHDRYDSVSNRTREDETSETFSIDYGTKQYSLSGSYRAQVLGSTVARLEILRASSRLNTCEPSEHLEKVGELLSMIVEDLEQHAQ